MGDWAKLTVVKLKEELKRRGLAQAGLKAVLVARLDEDDAANTVAADGPEEPEHEEETQPLKPAGVEAPKVVQDAKNDAAPPAPSQPTLEARPTQEGSTSQAEEDVPMQDAGAEATNENIPSENEEHVGEIKGREAEPTQAVVSDEVLSEGNREGVKKTDDIVAATSAEDGTGAQETAATTQKSEEQETQDVSIPVPTAELVEELSSQGPRTAEVPQLSTQTSVAPEEMVEDTRKRKRRSRSPAPQTQEVAMKKLKGEDGSPRSSTPEGFVAVQLNEEDVRDEAADEAAQDPSSRKQAAPDARFKSLFATDAKASSTDAQSSQLPDRDVVAAVHPATTTIYIRNFMRPLQAATLRDHLAALAEPDKEESAEDPIVEFFLDSIKSHCFVQFRNIAEASRVRMTLHNTVWPEEKSRKPLWADFVPEEKLEKWMQVELDAAGSRPPKRWEVVYENEDDKVVAYLQETETGPKRVNTLDSKSGIPSAPASAKTPTAPKGDPGRGFQALDDLFKSTTTKPKLYFLPVAEDISRKRLERLAKGQGGGRNDEMRRYTFEDQEVLVDNGPEFRPGYRGGGAAPRGGRRGGFPPRLGIPRRDGGFDSWRAGR